MSSKQLSSILDRAIPTTKKPVAVEQPPVEAPKEETPKAAEVVAITKTEKPKKAKPATPESQKAIQAYVPATVARALNIRAAEEGVTVRTIILQGLKAVGLDVPEVELRDRRK